MAYLNKALLALVIGALISGSAGADEEVFVDSPQVVENSDNPEELMALAIKYEHAEGVPRDYTKAVDLYCRAARAGHADAQYALGWMYANGRGVTRDDSVAALLFAMAGDQGHVHAREMQQYIQPSSPAPLPSCLLPEEPATQATDDRRNVDGIYSQPEEDVFLRGPIFDLVHKLASDYDVDPKLVLAVITVESGFKVRAKSPKNAQGLMQLIPDTAKRFRVKNVYDPADNIKGGMAYLQWLLAFFKGNVPLAIAAYNAGERAVEKYRGIPPYPETRDYVRKITKLYRSPTHPYKSNWIEPAKFVVLPATNSK